MNIEEIVNIEQQLLNKEIETKEEAALQGEIIIGEEFRLLKSTKGWKRLEEMILERTSSLSRQLLTIDEEKKLFRTQGELLGIQSILNIIENGLEAAAEAKQILEEK